MYVWVQSAWLHQWQKRLSTHSPSVHVMLHMYTWRRTTSRRKDGKWRDICKARHAKEKQKRTSQQGFWFFQLSVQLSKRKCILVLLFFLPTLSHSPMSVHARISRLLSTQKIERDRESALFFCGTCPREQREGERKRECRLFTCSSSCRLFLSQGSFEFGVCLFVTLRWHVSLVNCVRQTNYSRETTKT